MNTDQLNSLVRTVLKIIGTTLATHGATTAAGIFGSEALAGVVIAIVGVLASYNWHKDTSTPPPKPPTAPLVALLLTFGTAGLLFLTPGCGTPQAKVYQAEGVTIHTVDTAMQIWAEQVTAGKVTQAQIDGVHTAYNTYYDAQQIAKAALEKWIACSKYPLADAAQEAKAEVDTANAAVTNAVAAVIDLVNLYRK